VRRSRLLASLAAAVALAACTMGPAYHKPEVEVPAAWNPEPPWRESAPKDDALKGNWWEIFHDEQLNLLAQRALAENQNLRVAAARLDQARAQLAVSTAGLFPQIGLSAAASRTKTSADRPPSNPPAPAISTVQNDYRLGVSVSYEADLFGRVRSDVASARAFAQQAQADFENTRLVLVADLASNYFNLRSLDAEIGVVRESLGTQGRALDFVTARHDLGAVSGLDLAQQQSLFDTSATQFELLRNQRAQYEHAIATLVGTPAPSFALAPADLAPVPPDLPVGLPSDVLERRPDVASTERAMAAANARIGVARAAYFPSIVLSPSGGWESTKLSTLLDAPSIYWSLGVSATRAIFDFGRTRAGVDIAEASYAGAVASYRQTVLTAMQEVENGITGLTALGRAAGRSDASVRSSQRVLEIANDRYSGGASTYLEVITAQQALLNSQRQAVQIRGQRLLTSVYLIKALGGGWVEQPRPQ
jgi:multidrug efflux system outer membrane protein